jgi:hypothetical protein
MGSQSSEESEDPEIDLKEQRRLKRLDQLALARQKAAEVKKRRSAPKKELKQLEQQVKERLYQEDLERVERLKEQASLPAVLAPKKPTPTVKQTSSSSSPEKGEPLVRDRQIEHLDQLINILYG